MKKSNRTKGNRQSVVNKRELKNCWIRENDQYIHTDEMQVGILPYVKKQDEAALKENQIPYRKAKRYGKDVLEYWNPECFEEEEVEAPLYARMFGKYENLGKMHKGVKPTAKMIEMANAMQEEVSQKMEAYRENKKRLALYKEAKEALGDSWTCFKEVKHKSYFKYQDIQEGEDHIKCFPVVDAKGYYMEAVAFFNMNKVKKGGSVWLKVPKEMKGWVLGKKGTKIAAWAKEIGVERITLVQ